MTYKKDNGAETWDNIENVSQTVPIDGQEKTSGPIVIALDYTEGPGWAKFTPCPKDHIITAIFEIEDAGIQWHVKQDGEQLSIWFGLPVTMLALSVELEPHILNSAGMIARDFEWDVETRHALTCLAYNTDRLIVVQAAAVA